MALIQLMESKEWLDQLWNQDQHKEVEMGLLAYQVMFLKRDSSMLLLIFSFPLLFVSSIPLFAVSFFELLLLSIVLLRP